MLTSTTRTEIENEIIAKEAQLALANTALSNALTEIASYRLDTGEGSQQTKYRGLNELQMAVEMLEANIRSLYRRLNGTGIMNLNLRRKQYNRTR